MPIPRECRGFMVRKPDGKTEIQPSHSVASCNANRRFRKERICKNCHSKMVQLSKDLQNIVEFGSLPGTEEGIYLASSSSAVERKVEKVNTNEVEEREGGHEEEGRGNGESLPGFEEGISWHRSSEGYRE